MYQRVRYTVNDVFNNRFYQMPKFLFEGEFKALSNNARVLYTLLRDRHDLSLQNHWVNEKNEVYLIFTRKNMEEMLGLSDKTVKKAVDELKDFGLIEEEHMGLNKPNRIYLTSVNVENTGFGETPIPESENLRFRNRNNYDSRNGDSTIQETEILRTNDTELNNTDVNDTQSINHTSLNNVGKNDRLIENYSLDYIKEMLETEVYATDRHDNLYEELTNLVYDVVNETRDIIKINGNLLPTEVVRSRFLKLTPGNLLYVIEVFKKQTTKVNNIRQYLITALYNSFSTLDSYYTNAVNHDLYGA